MKEHRRRGEIEKEEEIDNGFPAFSIFFAVYPRKLHIQKTCHSKYSDIEKRAGNPD